MYDKKEQHRSLVKKTMSRAEIVRNNIMVNTEKVKKNLSLFVGAVTKSGKFWSAAILAVIGLIGLMYGMMLILQINDPITSTYALSYYVVPSALASILCLIGIAFSLYSSKKSYAYRGVIAAGLFFVFVSLAVVILGDVKSFITVGVCVPILGNPTTVSTNVWINAVSTALCGGSAGQKFIVDMIAVILITLLHVFWIVCLAILIRNSWKLEDINVKNSQVNNQLKAHKEKHLDHNNDDHAEEMYKMIYEDVLKEHTPSSNRVLHMGMDEFSRHIGCQMEKDDLNEEEDDDEIDDAKLVDKSSV